jgi:hypothetical protein
MPRAESAGHHQHLHDAVVTTSGDDHSITMMTAKVTSSMVFMLASPTTV